MVHPLVGDNQWALNLTEMTDRVLGQNCHSIGSDELRDSVVDLRIDVIRTTGEHDSVFAMFFQPCDCLLAILLHILAGF